MALVNGGFLHYMDMKKCLKNLLVWNHWSDFEIISQECSLCDPFKKLFVTLWFMPKHGSAEWEHSALYGHKEILKKSSPLKPLVRIVPCVTLFKNQLWNFDLSKKVANVGGGFLHCGRREIIQSSSPLKPLVRFWNNFIEMFLGWPFPKKVCEILICQ